MTLWSRAKELLLVRDKQREIETRPHHLFSAYGVFSRTLYVDLMRYDVLPVGDQSFAIVR